MKWKSKGNTRAPSEENLFVHRKEKKGESSVCFHQTCLNKTHPLWKRRIRCTSLTYLKTNLQADWFSRVPGSWINSVNFRMALSQPFPSLLECWLSTSLGLFVWFQLPALVIWSSILSSLQTQNFLSFHGSVNSFLITDLCGALRVPQHELTMFYCRG